MRLEVHEVSRQKAKADSRNRRTKRQQSASAAATPCMAKKKRRGSAMRSMTRAPTSKPAPSPSRKTVSTREKL